jgi:threonine dehydrogenase-like Zn-dependent dehydrogenase
VRELPNCKGVDFSFEAIGNPGAMTQAFQAVRRGGVTIAVGDPWQRDGGQRRRAGLS